MNNRRNYYRILQVQPEAPLEIIKASYRILMTKLGAHPDRGGDHETAVLLNQAYAVLSDAQKRKKYDDMLFNRIPGGHKNEDGASYTKSNRLRCFFCQGEYVPQSQKYCHRCQSPLTPVNRAIGKRPVELLGRRTVPRIAKAGRLVIYPSWPHGGHAGQLLDLSISGLSVATDYHAKTGQILKFDAPFFKGVGRVVSVRGISGRYSVHAAFLAAEFIAKSGTFITQKA